ncbi:hypothetical protein HY031_01930 [Candidatus Gottesmanbacteria bacterium]|nr:hypothetical protein [Candidatus Gottesmanbacteria bacterium]
MKGKLNGNTVGMIVGAFLGLLHLGWSVLVSMGLAQGLLNWIFDLHMLSNPYVVMQFDMTKAVTLVIFTSVVGYVDGWVFSWIWNMMVKK